MGTEGAMERGENWDVSDRFGMVCLDTNFAINGNRNMQPAGGNSLNIEHANDG